ncbi:MAG: hypothetical protein IPM06_17050 [Rhizobiales bacterium]|nr:hypothetical protein [Hyphomicrobiales bacterium]
MTAVGGLETHAGLRTCTQALTGIDFMELIRASAPGGTNHGPLSRDPAGGCGPLYRKPAKRTRRTRAEMEAAKAAEGCCGAGVDGMP